MLEHTREARRRRVNELAMTRDMIRLRLCFRSNLCNSRTLITLAAVLWLTGCSLADLSSLSRGHGKSSAGATSRNGGAAGRYASSTRAGATTTAYGGTDVVAGGGGGGSGEVAGGGGSGEVAGGGGSGEVAGGGESGAAFGGGAAGAESAGEPAMAGRSSGGSAGSDVLGGTAGTSQPSSCPAYDGKGGVLVTPPSNDFENNIDQWTKLSSVSGITRATGDGSACSGTAYLSCNGANRQAGWDGPSIALTPYVSSGHSYAVTLAVRFNKSTAPESGRSIGLTAITVCEGTTTPTYTAYPKVLTTSNWARLVSTQPLVVPPVGCTSLTHAAIYVETDDADATRSLDIDDFRLIDLTNPASSGGGAANATP